MMCLRFASRIYYTNDTIAKIDPMAWYSVFCKEECEFLSLWDGNVIHMTTADHYFIKHGSMASPAVSAALMKIMASELVYRYDTAYLADLVKTSTEGTRCDYSKLSREDIVLYSSL